MIKRFFLLVALMFSSPVFADITDIKFGRYQIADSQWNVSACLNTTTCQIYSKQPGTAYKIPWTSGQVQWATGDYVKFELSGNSSFPYTAKQYDSAGNVKSTLGGGKIVNMGPDYFFFVGSDNNTGQLFSGSSGMSNTSGVSWTGTLNPTVAQANTYANASYSTTPLAPGQTAAPPAPAGPSWKAIRTNTSPLVISNIYPTSNNSPSNETAINAFDGNVGTKYLNFDKQNAGVTVKLSQGRVVQKFTITTANDAVERDPASYKLYGSNDGVNWVLVSEGPLSLSNNRYTVSSEISTNNTTPYVYYFMLFPSIKNNIGNSVQIAELTYYYDENNLTSSTDQSGGGTISNPGTSGAAVTGENSLCCGGSNAAFNASQPNINAINAFTNRTIKASIVYIEQVGNNNSVTVNQSGTRNNYAEYTGNGNSNSVTINQSGNGSTQANYIDLGITGSNNSVNLTQQSTGGGKGIFAAVNNNSNSITVQQKDSGSHYLELGVSGGNKTVNITQQGSASHMASINLSGLATGLTLTQSGSTQQFYSITHSCATAGGCGTISVTQGQ
jgi:hypothetical protein